MSKCSFFLGLLVGIILSIAVFQLLPSLNKWLNNRSISGGNSTRDYVQEFADELIKGDYPAAWEIYRSKDNCGQYSYFPGWLIMDVIRLSTIYDHVPIYFRSSEQITQAMEANGVSLFENWCANFIATDGNFGNAIFDKKISIDVMECNGVISIVCFDSTNSCP